MIKIIGLKGLKGSGKTTVANYLKKKIKGSKRINFKDELIKEIKKYMPDVLAQLCILYSTMDGTPWTVDRLFNEKPPIMRALMQNFGTELRRGENKEYWTRLYLRKVMQVKFVITDDARFINEANIIRDNKGIIVEVIKDGVTDGGDKHSSEKQGKKIKPDFVLRGLSGDLEGLYEQIDEMLEVLGL